MQSSCLANSVFALGPRDRVIKKVWCTDIFIYQVTDGLRSKMRRGMEEFESLILNKYFLISIINSLEQQRKFTLKDK